MQRKVLFISYDGMTDPLGQSQVIPYLQGLSKNGYKIFLLSCEKQEPYAQHKPVVDQLLSGYDIEWIPLRYTKKPPVLSTLWDVMQLKKTALNIHKQHQLDMVHTRPGIPALVGLWLKQKTGIKYLHDIRDFYADSRVDAGLWNINNPVFKIVYNYFKRKEAKEIATCDGIVCLTNAAEKVIKQAPGFQHGIPLQVIPCSADLRLFNPNNISEEKRRQLKQELGIEKDDFVISYLGSVGGWCLTKEMLLFCKQLTLKIPLAKFLFIIPDEPKVIEAEALKYGLPLDKLIIRKGRRTEIPALLSMSEYSLFFVKACYSKISSSPTKHGEIMAMGLPSITNIGVGDVKEIVEHYNCGLLVKGFDVKDFEVVIDKIIASKKIENDLIRKGAEEYYSLDKAIEKYTSIYSQILA